MDTQATVGIPRAFHEIQDHRRKNSRHKLLDILTMAMMAVLCGADGWVAVAAYARAKEPWLRTILDLPHGIPSHDTFGDVFAKLNPDAFERCFRAWMSSLTRLSAGKLVAIDGKSLRRSFEHGWDKSGMAHMVSAYVEANHMVFAQVKTDGKGKELSAIEQLLETLELVGAVVTIDAIGCNKEITQRIIDAEADYILPVKDNQPNLSQKVKSIMDDAILSQFKDLDKKDFDFFKDEIGADHGRIETRQLWICWDEELLRSLKVDWPGIKSIIVVERTRSINAKPASQPERKYYISSLDRRSTAKSVAAYIRGHWSVENNLHWQLDVSFREDERRIRKGHGAENFSRLCRMSLNLLKQETTAKTGIAIKRQKCGWDHNYLLKVLLG